MQLQRRKRGLQRGVEITSPLHDSPSTMAASSLTPNIGNSDLLCGGFKVGACKWSGELCVFSSVQDERGGLKMRTIDSQNMIDKARKLL